MTFLEMVQKAIRWSGVRSTEPSTLSGATGLAQNMADAVSAAWEELQLERDDWFWGTAQAATGIIIAGSGRFFLSQSSATGGTDNKISGMVEYATATGTASITSATLADVQYFIRDCRVGINDDTDATVPDEDLEFIQWDYWPYHNEDSTNTGQPKYYSISPSGDMVVYPIPDASYRLFFITPKVPQVLTDDTDEITLIPEYLQKGVIFRGILYYGLYIQDPGIVELGRVRYRPYKKILEKNTMDNMRLGTPGTY